MKLTATADSISSAPLTCQFDNCGEFTAEGKPLPADYLLPQAESTTWMVVCSDHAEGWFKSKDALYARAAVRLTPLGEADKRFVVDSWG